MSGSAFGGYDKPNFQPKNLTSDMWEPISTTNNFSAYTPPRPSEQTKTQSGTRKSTTKSSASTPAKKADKKPVSESARSGRYTSQQKKTAAPAKRNAPKTNNKSKDTSKSKDSDRPISSGRVPSKKEKKAKTSSKRQQSLAEKRRQKVNLDFVRLINKGKTSDEARVIINRKKIRMKRIKTFGSVATFFLFALAFLLSYSYYRGAEISEILIDGDEVYSEAEILEAANIETGMNMLTVREKQVNEKVTSVLPFISKIGVDYQLPDTLALNIISTKEQLILKCARKYICVDKTGKVVSDKKKKLTEGQFLVQGLGEQEYTVGEAFSASEENAERYKIATIFAKTAEKEETLNYGVLDLEDLDNIMFTYRSKIRLYLGDSDNLEAKLDSAVKIMQTSDVGDKTGYINLKYDIGAYFMEGSME